MHSYKLSGATYTVDINFPSFISLAIGGRTLITTLRFSFPGYYYTVLFYFI